MTSLLRSLIACAGVLCASATLPAQQGETPIRVGDKISISLTGVPPSESQMMGNIPFTVANDGTIGLPRLSGEMVTVGLTPSALARKIELAYKGAEIYTTPRVNVSRILDATTTQLVSVGGEVRGTGSVVFRPGLRLLDAIMEKGGFTDFGDPKRVKLIRGNKTSIHNIKDVSKDPDANVELKPEDRIIVPQTGFFKF
ncbi:MAG: polysaccharide biosynthesis/export family protein [Verrucomicrobiales bacterium]